MIKLTIHTSGEPIWCAVDKITTVYKSFGYTVVRIVGEPDGFTVNESPEEVVRRIVSYKHSEMRLQALYKQESTYTGCPVELIKEHEDRTDAP